MKLKHLLGGHGVALALILLSGPGCSGQSPLVAGPRYEEYKCPAPIGPIIREDCSKHAIKYEGQSFEGAVGGMGLGAQASYQKTAIREAGNMVQLLKDQRVSLCNDFNTCKLTVAEYRREAKDLHGTFIALLALKDQMGQVDAEQAAILLGEIRRLRVDGGAEQTNKCPAGTVLTGTKCVAKAVEKPKLDRHNHGGHSYAILPRATSWHEASALCKNQNAHLATVGNAKENEFLFNTFGRENVVWLGATDERSEGTFEWVNGEPFAYANWAKGEPNNDGGNGHYATMGNWRSKKTGAYYRFGNSWNDLSASGFFQKEQFVRPVCEWDNGTADMPADGALVKGSGSEVYLIEAGRRRHVPNATTFNAMGFAWGAVKTLSDQALSSIPKGVPLPSR